MDFSRQSYESGRTRWETLTATLRWSVEGRKIPEWDEVPPKLQDVHNPR